MGPIPLPDGEQLLKGFFKVIAWTLVIGVLAGILIAKYLL